MTQAASAPGQTVSPCLHACISVHVTCMDSNQTCVLLFIHHFQMEKKFHGLQQHKTAQILL